MSDGPEQSSNTTKNRIEIGAGTWIHESELSFTFQRSPGAGGQNVNKVNTRVTLLFDIEASPSISESQKNRLRQKLATRINNEGVMRVVSSRFRTQNANRRAAIARFVELTEEALHQDKPRRKTKTPAGVKRRRLEDKRRRSQTKQLRRHPGNQDN